MNEDGLAMQGMAPQQPQGGISQELLEQVIALLQQGITPEELMQQGVPPEVIAAAIDILMQEQGGDQPQPGPATEGGMEIAGGMGY